jgi:hypothetical protein
MSVRRRRLIYLITVVLVCIICLSSLNYNSPQVIEFEFHYPREDPVWSLIANSEQKHNINNDKLESLISKSHFDISGKYKVIPYVFTAQNWTHLSKVRK